MRRAEDAGRVVDGAETGICGILRVGMGGRPSTLFRRSLPVPVDVVVGGAVAGDRGGRREAPTIREVSAELRDGPTVEPINGGLRAAHPAHDARNA
jgi:hypothetical protein